MNETALAYIQAKGFEHRQQSGQIVLETCPFCQDAKGHFYVDPTEGTFFCHHCQEAGNLITLKRHLGDFESSRHRAESSPQKAQKTVSQAFPDKDRSRVVLNPDRASEGHERLKGDHDALAYVITTRGISIEAVDHFKIGLETDQRACRWLTIPHFIKGKLVNIKSRSLPPADKTFKRITGCPSILFNADALEGADEIYIAEGEIDAVTLWDKGIKNVVGVTAGAGSFLPEWIDQLQAVKRIFLCYDPDEAGQKGAREAARRLGFERCFNVVLPDGQDVNDYFRGGHEPYDFYLLLNQVRQFDVAGIMDFQEGLRKYETELTQGTPATGVQTGFPSVDRIIRPGFQPGELIILSAPPKIGKSTLALQIATHNATKGIPSLFYCLEMRPMKVIQKIIQAHNESEEIGFDEIERTRIEFKGKPLYLGYTYQRPDRESIMETLKIAIRRYGLKLLVFDHLHFLCRSITNQTQEIGQAVQGFKFLAEEMEIPIILIAQPRKHDQDKPMTAMDLKDSISIFSDCDHLILLHRAKAKETAYEPETSVRIEASRYGAGGAVVLYYHGEYSRFDEITKRENEGMENYLNGWAGQDWTEI